ncbi:Hsp30p LALA0_S05e02718g [Lachancea lanzarotensis]|uniref:LALA0S05e02718g1_1 n=1 Tax=Lachancea lanzarotensis TaxID=1245769 RepID=A0A0C7NA08_9SACH|nr:uncharacterized protein LALA0_S05e02718g [Lachancea lanzarotensis]CEP62311.1 LALA0S05e02718g1_1 [Lachancea lanzarotensis]
MLQLELLKRAGNEAIDVNPAFGVDIKLTENGSDWLWAVFSVFALSAVIYAALFVYYEQRGVNLHRFAIAAPLSISLVLAFSYFTMASNLGWTGIQAEFNHQKTADQAVTPGIRQIFYAKYVAWFLTWPILLYLTELTGVVTIGFEALAERSSFFELIHGLILQITGSWFFIVGLLVGSLITSSYKWGYWTLAVFAQFLVTFVVFRHQLRDLVATGIKLAILILTYFCIWLYFVAWGLSDGGNVITVDSGHVFFGILDLLVFLVVPALLLATAVSLGAVPSFAIRRSGHHDLEKQVEPVRLGNATAANHNDTTQVVAVDDTAAHDTVVA